MRVSCSPTFCCISDLRSLGHKCKTSSTVKTKRFSYVRATRLAAKPGATVWRSAPTPAGASVPALRSGSVNQFVTELLAQASRSECRVLCASATYSLPAWRTVDSDARLCFTCQKLNSCSLWGKKDDMCHLWDLKRARDSSDLGRSRIQGLKRCLSVSSLSSLRSEHLCFLCLFFSFSF